MPAETDGILMLDEIPSTNDYLEELLSKSSFPEGYIVSAGFQSAGKGQENNHWESNPNDNILASMALYPNFLRADQQFYLTVAVSLSACSLITEADSSLNPMIKWPNDIFLNDRKICGILIKNSISGNSIRHSIAGMGMNINQLTFSGRAPLAISLSSVTGEKYYIPSLLTNWRKHLMYWYNMMRNGDLNYPEQEYLKRFYRLNESHEYLIRGKRTRATITGIGSYGWLKLKGDDGTDWLCDLKEVVFFP